VPRFGLLALVEPLLVCDSIFAMRLASYVRHFYDRRRLIPRAAARTTWCAELLLTSGQLAGHLPAETAGTSMSFTIFEGTSEIQRMIIGRAVTGLDVR
jgi:alkylation response protein AidB-like acyl-CoA dehydrogenase